MKIENGRYNDKNLKSTKAGNALQLILKKLNII